MENQEKDNQRQEFTGRNLEEVISHAEHVLKLPRSKFNYEIVAEKTKLFGIKTKEIVIRAWPKEKTGDDPAVKYLEKLLTLLPLEIKFHTKINNDILLFIFEGPDKNLLLQKDGALLMALQHLLSKVSSRKVQTDCDFYRKRKERELNDYVRHIAQRVHETGQNETLELMNPYERRQVHIIVNQISGITTESMGDGFLKKIKIFSSKNQNQ